jgi:MFS family permease
MLLPNSLALLGSAFAGAARGRAIGTWAAFTTITAAIGPLIGGWLIETVGWRAIFYLNLPLAAGAIALAATRVAETRAGKEQLDWLGVGAATLALGAVTWSLTVLSGAAPPGWARARTRVRRPRSRRSRRRTCAAGRTGRLPPRRAAAARSTAAGRR